MSNQIIIAFLTVNVLIVGYTAEFSESYKPKDFMKNENISLLKIWKNHMERSKEHHRESENSSEDWPGRWMPERPSDPKPPPKVFHKSETKNPTMKTISKKRVPMGVKSIDCDDGETNLTVDWDHSPVNYTCYGRKIIPEYRINAQIYCEKIPARYEAMHVCMNEVIEYDDPIPLYGSHRPIWATYGEYKFIPRQRWLHNLEHGAVVMLYHPCANPLEVERLKTLVTDCLRRYVITPSNLLGMQRPLALVTWGCRLTMSYVDREIVEKFIIEKSLHGDEDDEDDGDFDDGILYEADIVSDKEDSKLCPKSHVHRNLLNSNDEQM